MSRLWCRLTRHRWDYFIDRHGRGSRLCIRCGEAGWDR